MKRTAIEVYIATLNIVADVNGRRLKEAMREQIRIMESLTVEEKCLLENSVELPLETVRAIADRVSVSFESCLNAIEVFEYWLKNSMP